MGQLKAFFLYLFGVCFPLAVVSVSVSLYPSKSIVAPMESTVFINCSFNRSSQDTFLYWNISHELLRLTLSPDREINTDLTLIGVSKLSVVLNPVNADLDIQCQLCNLCSADSPAQDFTASTDPLQVNAFGPPSSLSHELRENYTVKLSWLPPVVEAVPLFTYNIIIMESTNNSLTVTDINITNNTYVIISPANINGYTNECTSYQWGVRAAANLSYGFTDVRMANDTFIFIAAPNITDVMVTSNISSIIFELIFSTSVEDGYTYTLYQRDYCENQLNSTEINNILIDTSNGTMLSINIQSLIHNETWSVSVEVFVCQYNDTTQYINVTNSSDTDRILDCKSDSFVSSTAITSLALSSSILSMGHTSFFMSSSSSSVTNTPSETPVSGKSVIVIGVLGGVWVLTLILIFIAALIAYKIKNKVSYYTKSNDSKETFELDINDTTDDRESPIANRSASIDGIESPDVSNEGDVRQTHLDPLPLAPNDEAKATPDSELATHQYADLDEIRSRKGQPPPPTVPNDMKYSQVVPS